MPSAAEYFAQRGVRQAFEVDSLTSPAASTSWVRPVEAYTRLTEPHRSEQQVASSQWWRDNFTRPLFLLITARELQAGR